MSQPSDTVMPAAMDAKTGPNESPAVAGDTGFPPGADPSGVEATDAPDAAAEASVPEAAGTDTAGTDTGGSAAPAADGRTGEESGPGDGQPDEPGGESLHVREGDIAADYLERLLDILDYDGDIDLDVEGDRAVVAVVGANLRGLIGPDGATLDALQELTRLAVAQQTGIRTRLMLDVGGHRAKVRTELSALGRQTAEEVKSSGSKQSLRPMNPFERKVVHDAVAEVDGVRSESEGEEPSRRVVVLLDV